jgi:hypothetical protein
LIGERGNCYKYFETRFLGYLTIDCFLDTYTLTKNNLFFILLLPHFTSLLAARRASNLIDYSQVDETANG